MQASLTCVCDLGQQLDGKCKELQQMRDAEAAQRDKIRGRDATVSRLQMQLQTALNRCVLTGCAALLLPVPVSHVTSIA